MLRRFYPSCSSSSALSRHVRVLPTSTSTLTKLYSNNSKTSSSPSISSIISTSSRFCHSSSYYSSHDGQQNFSSSSNYQENTNNQHDGINNVNYYYHPSLSPYFIKTLYCILYKISTTPSTVTSVSGRASPSTPQWVPIGVLSSNLPENLVEEEKLDEVQGGLRSVIEQTECLNTNCELKRDSTTGMWLVRTKPIFAIPSSSSSSSSDAVQLFAPHTALLAKFASKVTEQLLKIAKEEELEMDDDQDELDAHEKVFMTVTNLENFIDGQMKKKLIEQHQHLNIALVEAERWIPEAAVCWTLELRQLDKNANWSQSIVALKRDGSSCSANKSLKILKSVNTMLKSIASSSNSNQNGDDSNNNNNSRGSRKRTMTGVNLTDEDFVGAVGGVPLPPPPLQDGGGKLHYVDPTSLEYSTQNINDINNNAGGGNHRPSYLDELDEADVINMSGKRITPDTSVDIDLDLIPPAPSPERIAEEYAKRNQQGCLNNGQTYIGPNSTTQQELEGVALTVEDLMNFVPSFFIPVELALEQLTPLGYTQEHIENYFSSIKSVQLIKSSWPSSTSTSTTSHHHHHVEKQFIRIFAGGGKFDMSPILATNKRFARFEPLPALSRPFLKILTKPGQWMPIRDLLELAGKEAEESLPFQGSDALLYFAQLQQIFVFSVERGGIVARRPASQNFSLFSSTTPCPVFYNQLCRVIDRHHHGAGRNRIHVDAIPQLIGQQDILEEMQRCFPNWQAFAAAHREKFMFDASTNELMFTSAYEAEQRQQLSLEDQLEYAFKTRNMATVKSLKRKIATMRNPDNPLLDPERLAAAIAEFLPPTHHIKVASLLKSLPDEMRDLLPKAGLQKFLKRYPIYYTCFDYKQAGVRHVQRTGLALPSGALRNDFSKEEIVALCVQELQKRERGRMNVANLLLKMPGSVIENLKRGAALAGILKEYSESFVFVSSAGTVDVILVKPPSFVANSSGNFVVGESGGGGGQHYHHHQQEEELGEGTDDEWVAMAKDAFGQ